MLGRHLIKSWSSTQCLVSLSVGELAFYGVVRAAGIGRRYQDLLQEWKSCFLNLDVCTRADAQFELRCSELRRVPRRMLQY